MKLHSFPGSPNHRKVTAVAAHLGLPVEEVMVDFATGDNQKPEFLKMNPNGMIPVLQDGDFYLPESSAIMMYLCAQKPGNTLLPSDPKQHAQVMRWMFWQGAHFGKACGTILFEKLVKPMFRKEQPDMAEVAKGEEMFHRFARVLDDHMKDRKWLVGDNVTLADYANAAMLMYAEMAQFPVSGYPNMMAWYKRVEELDAWKKTAPQMPATA